MKKKTLVLLTAFFIMAGLGNEGHCKVRSMGDKGDLVCNKLIIKFDSSLTDEEKEQIREAHGLTLETESITKHRKANRNDVRQSMLSRVTHQGEDPQDLIAALSSESGVLYVEQDAYAYAFMTPNDAYFDPYQWHLSDINMENAWDLSTGDGVVVAVIDTGIMQSLEDFEETRFTSGYDFVNRDSDPTDDEGHGSHVAGTIAQSTDNGIGTSGIAFNCTLMPIKVLDGNGEGYYSDIVDGIYWAVDNGADIINMSLGGLDNLQALSDAVDYAEENGVLIVSAAGNDSSSTPSYPASYDSVISVSATGYDNTLASYSNYGTTIDLCAPGGDDTDYNGDGYSDYILQNSFTYSGRGATEGYYFAAGTSCAAPHVTGVAALVKSINSDLSAANIREILESTATDLGSSGWDSYYGYGLVDAYEAVVTALNSDASNTWEDDTDDEGEEETDPTSDETDDTEASTSEGIHVSDIQLDRYQSYRSEYVVATVIIRDDDDNLVSDAQVSVRWSGSTNRNEARSTDRSGKAMFQTAIFDRFFHSSVLTITVEDVSHSSLDYIPEDNVETSDSI